MNQILDIVEYMELYFYIDKKEVKNKNFHYLADSNRLIKISKP